MLDNLQFNVIRYNFKILKKVGQKVQFADFEKFRHFASGNIDSKHGFWLARSTRKIASVPTENLLLDFSPPSFFFHQKIP